MVKHPSKPIDFATERERHEHLFGRDDVLAEMDAKLLRSPWMLITGGPGLGKSALLEHWLRRREQAGLPTAYHFIRRGVRSWAEPELVRANLAVQVARLVSNLRNWDLRPGDRLDSLLYRIGPELAQRDQRLVLIVDGLDELSIGDRSPVTRMVPVHLPARVHVVFTSRPDDLRMGWLEHVISHRIDLDARTASNEAAVRGYWAALGPSMDPPLTPELERAAVAAACGNLLHAVKLRELWSRPGVERSTADLPYGLAAMLGRLWARIDGLPADERARARDGLGLICAARAALPLHVVEELLSWGTGVARAEVLPNVRELLHEERQGEQLRYRPVHECVRELVERELPRTSRHEELLAAYSAWPLEGEEFRRRYALRHRIAHQHAAGMHEAAANTCRDVAYLTAKASDDQLGAIALELDVRMVSQGQNPEVRRQLSTLGRVLGVCAHWAMREPEALPSLLHDRLLTHAPTLIRELAWPSLLPRAFPRLRHPLQARALVRVLEGHEKTILCVAALRSGCVVSGSRDGSVRVWDPDTGVVLAVFADYLEDVLSVTELPDGRLVSSSKDKTIRVWDLDSGTQVARLRGAEGVSSLAALPDGRVVSSFSDDRLRIWNLDAGAATTLGDYCGKITGVAVLPDGRVVAAYYQSKSLRVWDPDTGNLVSTLEGHGGPVTCVAVLPDGRVVSGSHDHTTRVWNPDTGVVVATFECPEQVISVAALPDGRVVSACDDKTLRVWDVETATSVATLRYLLSWLSVAVLPDGRIVAAADDRIVSIWDPDAAATCEPRDGHSTDVYGVTLLPDGRVVSGSRDKTSKIWDPNTGTVVATLDGRQREISHVATLPDGRVVSVSSDRTAKVWDLDTRSVVATLKDRDGFYSVAVLPDGRLVTGGRKAVCVWDVDAAAIVATLEGHENSVCSVAVLPDGRVVSGSSDRTVRIWDIDSGAVVLLADGQGEICTVAALPDGRVAFASYDLVSRDDATIRVWDVESRTVVTTLHGHLDSVRCLAVLPDGRLVSGACDHTLRVWDLATGTIIATHLGDETPRCVAVGDGLLVAGDGEGNVWFVDLESIPPAPHSRRQ